jgi:hypothetical protein
MTPTELRHIKINAVAQGIAIWAIGLGISILLVQWLGLNLLEQWALGVVLYFPTRRAMRPYWTALATYRERENEDA